MDRQFLGVVGIGGAPNKSPFSGASDSIAHRRARGAMDFEARGDDEARNALGVDVVLVFEDVTNEGAFAGAGLDGVGQLAVNHTKRRQIKIGRSGLCCDWGRHVGK